MARRKKRQDGGGGDPAWLITFSDLMTLLLTFFVLLLSMSVIDERAKLVVLGSVSRNFGVAERIFNPLSKRDKSSAREIGVMEEKEDDLAAMRDMVYDDVSKDLDFQENKFVQIFSINDDVLFEPGGTNLTPQGIVLLDRILPYLQRIEHPLLVAGHTALRLDEESSNYTVSKYRKSADSTWLISYSRALSVYRHLIGRGISPDRLSLEAFGQFHPRYSNNSDEGRKKNRRVDLVLDKRNTEWIRKVEELQESNPAATEHYYQGFRFDLTLPENTLPGGRR